MTALLQNGILTVKIDRNNDSILNKIFMLLFSMGNSNSYAKLHKGKISEGNYITLMPGEYDINTPATNKLSNTTYF